MKQILIADSEIRTRKLISDFLTAEKFDVIEAKDGSEALQIFSRNPEINLIILDVNLPGRDGWSVCRRIRMTSTALIIFLTGREEETDELFAFELGADDFIKKPFNPYILAARVNALMKRGRQTQVADTSVSVKQLGGIHIDEAARLVSVDGNALKLSPREYALLLYFTSNHGLALSRNQILKSVWNYDYSGYERTVDTHIKRLRLKLSGKREYIQTVRNYGYRFQVRN